MTQTPTSRRARPLSPHIQIYRWTLTMLLSILHRATGLALYAGSLLFLAWLSAIASGPEAYGDLRALAGSDYGRAILFLYSWALLHHMFGGVRHFVWDMGRGFSPRNVELLAWATALAPLLLTALVWGILL